VPIQASSPEPKKSRWPSLYVQVLLAIALAVALGKLEPRWGVAMRPLGDGFVRLVLLLTSKGAA
jgi:aerobic C4-dicarboxylate transport protein